jgi:uncharacterized protein involved in exopolysaccharide biosynthesis
MAEGQERSLREVFLGLWAYKWTIIGCVAVFTTCFAAIAFVTTPEYRATTILAPANTGGSGLGGSLGSSLGQLGGLASMVGINVGSSEPGTEEAIAVLRSRQFTETFISDKNLLPQLFAPLWDSKTGTWKVAAAKQPTLGRGYKVFDEGIRSVVQNKKTGLVTLQIDWRDPAISAAWANELVDRLNREMRSRALEQATKSLSYLDGELAKTNEVDTRAAISRLIEMQIRQRMMADVTEQYAFRVVDRATVVDKWDKIRPKKLQLILTGLVLGLVFGVFLAAFRGMLNEDNRPHQ